MQPGSRGGHSEGLSVFNSANLGESSGSAAANEVRGRPQIRTTPRGIVLEVPRRETPQIPQGSFTPLPKRQLSEFQSQPEQHSEAQNPLLMRSVRQRFQNQRSPVSPVQQQQERDALEMIQFPAQQQLYSQNPTQPLNLGHSFLSIPSPLSQHQQPYWSQLSQSTMTVNVPAMQNFQSRAPVHQTSADGSSSMDIMQMILDAERELSTDDYINNPTFISENMNPEPSNLRENPSPIISSSMAIFPSSTSHLTPSTPTILSVGQRAKQILIDAAVAIFEVRMDVANDLLAKLSTRFADPFGAPELRAVHYMVTALRSLAAPAQNEAMFLNPLSMDYVEATHLLYERSVCFKLGFMCSNMTIVKAAMESTFYYSNSAIKIHLVDFDIGKGDHYQHILTVINSLRQGRNSVLKITTIWEQNERLNSVLEDANRQAQRLGIELQFKPLTLRIEELNRESIGVENDEFFAVNFPFLLHRMPDESVSVDNPRDALLRKIKAMSPNIVTMVEQELNTNTASLVTRLQEAYDHYTVLLDTIEPFTSSDVRVKIERLLSQKMANSVVCEGVQRIERCEVYSKWKARMNMAGFRMRQMSHYTAQAMRVNLSLTNRQDPGFMIIEKNGVIELCKNGKTIIVGSAWV